MNKQNYFRQKYLNIKPDWEHSVTIYKRIVNQLTTAETKILDVGCGHGDSLKSVYNKTIHTYGIDPDKNSLDKNSLIRNKVAGVVEDMPFKSDFFDLVVSEWVLEHLHNPKKAFSEIYRVLKPGGKVVFITPNVWNYNVWIIRLIPNCFHSFLSRKLYDRVKGDTYPVRYKINSPKAIARTFEQLGFTKCKMIFNGDPSYISFNRPLFIIACFLEKILDLKLFNSAKVHIIGVYEKDHLHF